MLYDLYEMYDAKSVGGEPQRTSVSEARQSLSDIVNTVAYGNRRVVLARHGRDLVAIVPIADLRRLESMGERASAKPSRTPSRPGPGA
jgi:prevent-host-death family protein